MWEDVHVCTVGNNMENLISWFRTRMGVRMAQAMWLTFRDAERRADHGCLRLDNAVVTDTYP
jgi:hypothetical protein